MCEEQVCPIVKAWVKAIAKAVLTETMEVPDLEKLGSSCCAKTTKEADDLRAYLARANEQISELEAELELATEGKE